MTTTTATRIQGLRGMDGSAARCVRLALQMTAIKAAVECLALYLSPQHEDFQQLQEWSDAGGFCSEREEARAFVLCRKHRNILKSQGYNLGLKFEPRYSVKPSESHRDYIVENLSKGTFYELGWIGTGVLACSCPAYQHKKTCNHVDYALEVLGRENPTDASERETLEPETRPVKASLEPSAPVQRIPKCAPQVRGGMSLEDLTLTECQEKALQEMNSFIEFKKPVHGLFGFAGTGKTFLLQVWLKRLRDRGYSGRIVFTAPTNKAVGVLQGMVGAWGLDIDCLTCSKLLGLKPKIDPSNGKEYFVKDSREQSSVSNYQIVVVDEASMVSSGEGQHKGLWEHLTEESGLLTQLLFVGDWAQLPPVGEAISQVFLKIEAPSQLSEVKRYRGSIAAIADQLRSSLHRKTEPFFETDLSSDGSEGVACLTSDGWKKALIKAFSSEKYSLDPNFCRAIAWTNKATRGINTFIREEIRGKNAHRFVPGERLIATQHYAVSDFGHRTILNNSAEVEVLDVYEGTLSGYKVWYLQVQILELEGDRQCIPVLHEDDQKTFEATQKEIRQEALNGDHSKWKKFHDRQRTFAWVDYAYALTAHKSQGSTFKNVFVDIPDILRDQTKNTFEWPDDRKQLVYERNQLLYVALTRASHRVLIYE